ncbi:MAG: putative UDP-glucose 4-epimerase [Promethearchaeota archaeon]|nr:MAG: putative UDP-glucose 4-epimerase [Candidatus Lokiarchaeota archaeon]
MKKILITGATGFIGGWLTKFFIDDGYGIVAHGSSEKTLNTLEKNLSNSHYSLQNTEFWAQDFLEKSWDYSFSFSDLDFIIHTAAATKVREGTYENYEKYYNLNVVAVKQLAKKALEEGISHFVHLSTGQIFGHPKYFPITENTPKNPINLYGYTKLMGEKVVESLGVFNLLYTIVRPFSVYGKGQDNIIQIIIDKIKNNEALTVYGDGTQSRAFMHIKDFYNAIKLMLGNPSCFKESFNLSGDKEYSVNYLIGFISDVLKKKPDFHYEEPKFNELKRNLADTSKIQKLGFSYECELEEFIEKKLIHQN